MLSNAFKKLVFAGGVALSVFMAIPAKAQETAVTTDATPAVIVAPEVSVPAAEVMPEAVVAPSVAQPVATQNQLAISTTSGLNQLFNRSFPTNFVSLNRVANQSQDQRVIVSTQSMAEITTNGTIFASGSDFLQSQPLFLNSTLPAALPIRDLILVDSGNPASMTIVRNTSAGPASVGAARIVVDSTFYAGVAAALDRPENVMITVNSATNAVSAVTVTGSITSTSANISVQ